MFRYITFNYVDLYSICMCIYVCTYFHMVYLPIRCFFKYTWSSRSNLFDVSDIVAEFTKQEHRLHLPLFPIAFTNPVELGHYSSH